jgi:hypothetical protein
VIVKILDNHTRERLEAMRAEIHAECQALEAERAGAMSALAEAEALATREADRLAALRVAAKDGLDSLATGRPGRPPIAASLASLIAEDEGPKGPLAQARGEVARAKGAFENLEYQIGDRREALEQIDAMLAPKIPAPAAPAPVTPSSSDLPPPEGFETIEMPDASASGG